MNERIGQLAEQAKQYAEDEQNNPLKIYTLDCFNEKFAELIVRECMQVADSSGKGWAHLTGTPGNRIKQHFGVEL
jgi:hypothetical protein